MKNLFSILVLMTTVLAGAQEANHDGIIQVSNDSDAFLSGVVITEVEDDLSNKMQIFEETYVYQDGLRVRIEKPLIYKGVRRVNRYLAKQLKEGKISEVQANHEMASILNIAIDIYSIPTEDLELALKNEKNPERIIRLLKETV